MSNEKKLTVGELRRLIDDTDLDDDAEVIIVEPESGRSDPDIDDGQRWATTAAAIKGVNEPDELRIRF